MSPQWQLWQKKIIPDFFYLDHWGKFGISASVRVWCCFFSLVLWIATNFSQIKSIFAYIDNSWGGGGLSLEMVTYSYHLFPLNQANWVFLGIGSNRFLAHPSTSLTSSSLLLNYLSLFHLQRSLTWSLPSDIFFFSTLPPSHWMVSHPWLGLMGSQLLPSWLLWWKEMSKAFQTLIVKW